MKIEFDNKTETNMFSVLLDMIVSVTELENDEIDFINMIYEELAK